MTHFPTDIPAGPDDIEQKDSVFLDDFENDDLVFFHHDFGFSINIENQTFLLFQRINGDWFDDELPLPDLRKATETTLEAGEVFAQNQFGGARGIGESIGLGIRNSMEKSKARNGSGITLHFRSIERPTFFLNITDANERAREPLNKRPFWFSCAKPLFLPSSHSRSPLKTTASGPFGHI